MAALMVAARCALGWGITVFPTTGTSQRFAAIALVIAVAVIFGGYDGLMDARRFPDADKGVDLTARWFKAALFGGVVSGAVCWALGSWLLPGIGQGSLPFELVIGACFTTLLLVISASIGAVAGRRLAARQSAAA
ncbi:B-4DMT family transporter [Tsukamurella strandjordii]